ncbi:30S ribosomal protein S27ae [Candidatus Bathyarchaeota archaeon]|nr:30S ribosomal protein S27ae [Candidatus Bathyarchaeota archaeon]
MGKKRRPAPRKEKVKKKKKAQRKPILSVGEDGTIVRSNVQCPRCGPGFYMAQHYDRRTCGNCSFTQFLTKDGNVRSRGSRRTRQRRPRRSEQYRR